MNSPQALMEKYWGWSEFRPGQKEAISASISGKNTLVLLPTGGGKSLCYQLAALSMGGVCVVVSPLIALMIDQVEALKSKNIRAMSISGPMRENELVEALDQCAFGDISFLYISPERLQNPIVLQRLKTLSISLLAVDEAHCISQWGHDFRPSYRKINNFHQFIGKPPVMALTATATPKVKQDITDTLELPDTQIIQTSFVRPNLLYQVHQTENKLASIQSLLTNATGNTIIYLRTRRHCETLVEQLGISGIRANYFHGGSENKTKLIEEWSSGRNPIMVATTAFGMGIDQPNVRQVIHAALPESVESYYQEAGRAGRDGKRARAIIINSKRDVETLKRQFIDPIPNYDFICQVYTKVCSYFQIAYGELPEEPLDLSFKKFLETYRFSSKKTYEAFQIFDKVDSIRWTNQLRQKYSLQILYKGKELRKYIEKNAPLSSLVNVLVRLYPKITENYQSIDVIKLSKRTGVHLERLKEQLTALAQNGLADIDAWQCDTRLYFLEPREDKHTLSKVKKHLTQLKNTRKLQLKSIENYIKENEICKQSMIVKYFGEKVEAPCGQCSSCQSEPNSIQLQKRILEALQSHPLSVIELSQLLVTEEKVIIAALDEMINEEKIKRLNGKFHIQS